MRKTYRQKIREQKQLRLAREHGLIPYPDKTVNLKKRLFRIVKEKMNERNSGYEQ